MIEEPRLLEIVRTDDVASLPRALDAFATGALAPAEAAQASTGGSNPRFGSIFDEPAADDGVGRIGRRRRPVVRGRHRPPGARRRGHRRARAPAA